MMKKHASHSLATILLLASLTSSGLGQSSPVALLMLTDEQAIKLDQLWDYVFGIRFEEEQRLGRKGASASEKDRAEYQSRIVTACMKAKDEANKLLRPAQREILAIQREKLRPVAEDGIKMLVFSLEELLETPLDESAARRWRFARDSYNRQSASTNRYGLRGFGLTFGHGWHYGPHSDSHGTHIGWHHGHHGGHRGGRQ